MNMIALTLSLGAQSPTSNASLVAKASNAFGLKIAERLPADSRSNFVLSPFSLFGAMGSLYAGTAGKTRAEVRAALGLPGESFNQNIEALSDLNSLSPEQRPVFTIANSVWTAPTFSLLPAYVNLLSQKFGAEAAPLQDLGPAGVQQINGWVGSKTGGMIPKLIDKLNPETKVVLLNAIYFNGKWASPFRKDWTHASTFGSGGASYPVSMMRALGHMEYGSHGSTKFVRLPYQNGFSMWIALPEKGTAPSSVLGLLSGNVPVSPKRVDLELPKFHFDGSYSLNKPLEAVGLTELFQHADLTRMSPNLTPAKAKVSDVLQKTKIQVDELGTKAAAATAVMVVGAAMMREDAPIPFHVNHPFAFAIKNDATGAVLFLGAISHPK